MSQLDRVGLSEFAHRPVSGFSRGMAQRLSLARALLPNPSVLLLDEPFTGLDQAGIAQAEALILEQRAKGAVIILSSHDLSVTERLCDRVLILRRGRCVFYGELKINEFGLKEQYHRSIG